VCALTGVSSRSRNTGWWFYKLSHAFSAGQPTCHSGQLLAALVAYKVKVKHLWPQSNSRVRAIYVDLN